MDDCTTRHATIDQRLAAVEAALEDLGKQVGSLVDLREQLNRALDLRKRTVAAPTPDRPRPTGGEQPGAAGVAATRAVKPALAAAPPSPPQSDEGRAQSEPITVIHLEDHAPLQEAAQAAVDKFAYARYQPGSEPLNGSPTGRRLLALNLFLQSTDPLRAVADSATWGIENPSAFTYCADGTRGVTLGMVDFFPPPFEPDACVTRLLERPGATQRLLVVCDALDATTELRTILTRLGCPTSVAFDARQALDLVPMVRPDLILVDLNVPRGEALRVISRVRADPAYTNVTFALMWRTAIDPAAFRQQVTRAIRDLPFSADDLRRAIARELGPTGAAFVSAYYQKTG